MSDAVKVAIINQLPAIISALGVMAAVILGFINKGKISTVETKVGTVETKVDGRMSAMTEKVDDLQRVLLDLTGKSSKAEGKLEAQDEAKNK